MARHKAAAGDDTAPPAAPQAQARALERRVLVKDREWKQAEADRKGLTAQREALQDDARAAVGKGPSYRSSCARAAE